MTNEKWKMKIVFSCYSQTVNLSVVGAVYAANQIGKPGI